jgi:hypothetical protein
MRGHLLKICPVQYSGVGYGLCCKMSVSQVGSIKTLHHHFGHKFAESCKLPRTTLQGNRICMVRAVKKAIAGQAMFGKHFRRAYWRYRTVLGQSGRLGSLEIGHLSAGAGRALGINELCRTGQIGVDMPGKSPPDYSLSSGLASKRGPDDSVLTILDFLPKAFMYRRH